MKLRTISLLIGIALFVVAGCGILTQSLGSVTLHTECFGLAFFALSFWPKEKE